MHRTFGSILGASWLLIVLAGCAPLERSSATEAAPTQSGFPTLSAPNTQQAATPTRYAAPTALLPGTALPTVMVQSSRIPVMGSGDADVNVNKWVGPALLHAKYTGGDIFGVQGLRATYGELGVLKTLIDATGPYEGTVPLDFEQGQPTTRLQVLASGPWVIEIRPLDSAKPYQIPATVNGKGDDVVLLQGGAVGSIMGIAAGGGRFVVDGYDATGTQVTLFDELAPFTGAVGVDAEVSALAVHSTATWSLQIATK